jgi:glycosyltransferase involved in cell wall biosynthesis
MSDVGPYPVVSVIVPVKNGERFVEACLSRLERQRYPRERFEIVVVDNGSTDRTRELCARHRVTLERADTPGPSAARNIGIRRSRGEILLFTDIDCLADEELVLGHALAHLRFGVVDPAVQVIGGGIAGVNGSLWALCDDLCSWSAQSPALPARAVGRCLASANLSVSRGVVEAVGGFDEELHCAEDIALCGEARRLGFKLHFEPRARVAHVNRTSWRDFVRHPSAWARFHCKLFEKGFVPCFSRRPWVRALAVLPMAAWGTFKTMSYALRARRLEAIPLVPFIALYKSLFALGQCRATLAYLAASAGRGEMGRGARR